MIYQNNHSTVDLARLVPNPPHHSFLLSKCLESSPRAFNALFYQPVLIAVIPSFCFADSNH